MKISEVEPIHDPSDYIDRLDGTRDCVVTREELAQIVEIPCLAATLLLYDKNIQTVDTSANRENIGLDGIITIEFTTLSDYNKEILKTIYPEKYAEAVEKERTNKKVSIQFTVPLREDSTVEGVSQQFIKLTKDLEIQDVLFGQQNLVDFIEDGLIPWYDEINTVEEGIEALHNESNIQFLVR